MATISEKFKACFRTCLPLPISTATLSVCNEAFSYRYSQQVHVCNYVIRHKPRLWNAMRSGMFIENTSMHYRQGSNANFGITVKPRQQKDRHTVCIAVARCYEYDL